jgi:hypothetical protein
MFLCCDACKKSALANPKQTLARVADFKSGVNRRHEATAGDAPMTNPEEMEIRESLSKLSPQERAAAEAQRFCVVLPDSRLGSMGKPERLEIDGAIVFVCCEGCTAEALANPKVSLAKAAELKKKSKGGYRQELRR